MQGVLIASAILAYISAPVSLIAGWISWTRKPKTWGFISSAAFVGFIFGSASALLAATTLLYVAAGHGFAYYDPTLLRIYKGGLLSALIGFLCGIPGMFRKNSLRWYAPALSISTFVMWFIWASLE